MTGLVAQEAWLLSLAEPALPPPPQLQSQRGWVGPKGIDVLAGHLEAVEPVDRALRRAAGVDQARVHQGEEVVVEAVDGGLHVDVAASQEEGERGEELVDVGECAAGEGGEGTLQQRAEVTLGKGEQVLEGIYGKTEERKMEKEGEIKNNGKKRRR